MPKAYWVTTYREIKDPAKLTAYSKLAPVALAPFGVRHLDLPFTPERILTAIRSSERLSRASGGPSPSGTAR